MQPIFHDQKACFYILKNLFYSLRICIYENTYLLTSYFPSLFKVPASLFVQKLKVWLKSIVILASFEEGQTKKLPVNAKSIVETYMPWLHIFWKT